ncbi:protein phosphatase 1 regulatory subunit 42, partial [Flavobacteriales bacterium]|nr:protein phosphatase 1 regulatory subunit 42 [Flavobacteriales bacterium]
MKKLLLILLYLPLLTFSQQTYVPDNAFETWCELSGYGDGIANNDTINTAWAAVPTNISLDNVGISDLTGLEAFTSLTILNVANNNLSSIDISFLGNNLTIFSALNNNSDLYCITVFDTTYTANHSGYLVESYTAFSTNCNTAFGCMDSLACNYNSLASIDTVLGGSCVYNAQVDTNIVACQSFTWSVNGGIYTTSGTYSDTLTTINGCDSLMILYLTIVPSYSDTLLPVISCDSFHWDAGIGGSGITYYTSGLYTIYFTSVDGCDSVVHLDLTIGAGIFGC